MQTKRAALRGLRVRDIMTPRPRTATPELSVWSALALMRAEDIRHLPVVRGGALVGMLSNRDFRRLLEWAGPDGRIRRLRAATVAEIMTSSGLAKARPNTPVRDILRVMAERKVGAVPVVNRSGRLVGIVTGVDVIRALACRRQRPSRSGESGSRAAHPGGIAARPAAQASET